MAITSFHEPSFVFLTGRDTELTDAAGAARALAEGRPAIVEARRRRGLPPGTGRRPASSAAPSATVDGHNYSNGDDVSLTVYAPPGEPVASGAAR